ncbi:MAG: PilZ domain-containing protein [Desulfobacterota bacterium]|nr:PilZ domain-containing protein [Thermodesulfobacteriota bacterium]
MQERRRFRRIAKAYHMTYGSLNTLVHPDEMKSGTLHNIGAGGISFSAADCFPPGTHLVVTLKVNGWKNAGNGIKQSDDPHASALLKTIVEVVRVAAEATGSSYRIAAKFLGRVTHNAGGDT